MKQRLPNRRRTFSLFIRTTWIPGSATTIWKRPYFTNRFTHRLIPPIFKTRIGWLPKPPTTPSSLDTQPRIHSRKTLRNPLCSATRCCSTLVAFPTTWKPGFGKISPIVFSFLKLFLRPTSIPSWIPRPILETHRIRMARRWKTMVQDTLRSAHHWGRCVTLNRTRSVR